MDELRSTGAAAPDDTPDTASTTEVTLCGGARNTAMLRPRMDCIQQFKPAVMAQPIAADPDTGIDIDINEIIYMEEHPSTSMSTSGSSTSDSDEGSDEDEANTGADSEPRAPPTRGGIPPNETAFADSSVAFTPATPAVPSRGVQKSARKVVNCMACCTQVMDLPVITIGVG